jgi:TRAP-type mannitol/chloroaromatic compound transport system permease small subunit
MHTLFRGIDRLSQVLGLSVAHFYLIVTAITSYEVIARYVFNAPTMWAFELVMVLCASAWALSGGYVTMRRGHIAITVLYQYSTGTVRWLLDLFIQLMSLVAMLVLAYALWEPMTNALRQVERSGSSFNSPEPMLVKTILFAGTLLYALQTLVTLIRILTEGRVAPPPQPIQGE